MRFSKFWIFILILAISIIGLTMILGCSDDNGKDGGDNETYQPTDEDFDDAAGAAVETAMFSNTISTAYSTTQQEDERGDIEWDNGGCPFVTLVGEVGNRTLTITYNDTCDFDGVSISGVISGAWNYVALEGFTANLDINNFNVEGVMTNGSLDATATATGFLGGQLTLNGEISQEYEGNSRSMTVSELTVSGNLNLTPIDPFDDYYILDGAGTYTDIDGIEYSLDFDNVKAIFMCYFPVSGILTIEGENITTIIDFGDGECDSEVTITIGNITKTIDLVEWLSEY